LHKPGTAGHEPEQQGFLRFTRDIDTTRELLDAEPGTMNGGLMVGP
jgi:hypothetical protein